MHYNSLKHCRLFFETYGNRDNLSIGEIGSYDVNGSVRSSAPNNCTYVGFDFNPGPGVDVILNDPYHIPVADNTFDMVVSSSCFEHSEMFWLTYLEALRILKPSGLLYINAPSSWMCYHRFPVDCWRFYPDAAKALDTWSNRNNIPTMVLESYISTPSVIGECADNISVFLKDRQYVNLFQNRIVDKIEPYTEFFNAFRFPLNEKFTNDWSWPNFSNPQGVDHPLKV